MDDQTITYVSRTLSAAEKHYSQLEKEALAIIFAVKKFHKYIYGRYFIIESDHRPLSFLFVEHIQRWALTLSAYQYTIRYKAGKHLTNADAFSRLPAPATTVDRQDMPEDLVQLINHFFTCINHLFSTCISSANIKDWTTKDPSLSCVRKFVMTGWPEDGLPTDYQPYTSRRDQLSVLAGCLLWGSCVIVHPQDRQVILDETHPGINKMKALARSYLWVFVVAWHGQPDSKHG